MAVDLAAIKAAKNTSTALEASDMTKLFWLIHGEKQVGKSTFTSRFPSPFFIDPEHRLDSITTPEGNRPGQHKVYSWDEAVEWTDAFAGTTPADTEIETIIIDGGGVLYKMLAEKILAGSKKKAQTLNDEDLGYAKGWIMAANLYLKWVMSLRKLKEQGYGVVITTHDRSVTFTNNGVDMDKKVPLIANDKDEKYGWIEIRPFMDIVVHASKVRTKDGVVHMARVRGNDLVEAGFPNNPHGLHMPEELPFVYSSFREAWDAAPAST